MMTLPLAGRSVDRLVIDYAFTLVTGDGDELRFETVFRLGGPLREEVRVDPEHLGVVDWINLILRVSIARATAENLGKLTILFANDVQIKIAPDEHFEAWSFAGADGSKIVAQPGSGLLIFPIVPDGD